MLPVAIVFQLALDGADPVVPASTPASGDDAAPQPTWSGLCRQLPRMMTLTLNGDGDRGVRFFPFIGSQGQSRGFLHVPQLFDVEVLDGLHRQDRAWLLVDGLLTPSSWRLRVFDRELGRVAFDQELPFDPQDPRAALDRAVFELTGLLRWTGAPPRVPAPPPPALGPFLEARDQILALEASMIGGTAEDVVVGAMAAVGAAARDPAVGATCVELARLLVQIPGAEAPAVTLLTRWVDAASPDAAALEKAAQIAEVARRPDLARSWYLGALERPSARRRAVALSIEAHDLEGAAALAREAIEAGDDDAHWVTQMAVISQRQGDRAAWRRWSESLVGRSMAGDALNAAAARVAADYLVFEERETEAIALLESTLAAPGDAAGAPMLWLALARAKILAGRAGEAIEHLDRCASLDPPSEVAAEVRRLRRFAHRPTLVAEMLRIENQLVADDSDGALADARALVRSHKGDAEAWLVLGIVEHRAGRERRAERALRRALRRDPHLGEAQNRLGILLLARGRAEEGHGLLIEAVRQMPTDPACRLHLAQACALIGRTEEGREHVEQARRLGADPATVARVEREFFAD